jgi:hypothetical protein
MEEGKINGFGHSLCDWKKSINVYKNACATWSNTLLAWGRFDHSALGEPASRFTSAIERSGMEEGKIATAWAQFVRLKEVHQCI